MLGSQSCVCLLVSLLAVADGILFRPFVSICLLILNRLKGRNRHISLILLQENSQLSSSYPQTGRTPLPTVVLIQICTGEQRSQHPFQSDTAPNDTSPATLGHVHAHYSRTWLCDLLLCYTTHKMVSALKAKSRSRPRVPVVPS